MTKHYFIYSKCKTLLVSAMLIALPVLAHAEAGKVEFASGGAALQAADGSSKVLTKGMEINAGDTILTGKGRAQVKFSDGGYMSFQPGTEFKVEEYNYNGKQDGTEKGFFRLVAGGMRAVTGLVGKQNKPAYRVATPVATVGIRGTYFLAEFNEKLKAHCGHGSIYVFNDQGNIILFEGQSAEVKPGSSPQYTDEQMTLGSRGPEGAQPEADSQQQTAESDFNSTFKLPELYQNDGVSCGLGTTCSSTSAIANLNGMYAYGSYTLDNTVANAGGGAGWNTKVDSANIYVNFGNYSAGGNVTISATPVGNIDVSSTSTNFSLSGTLLPSAVFSLKGDDPDSGFCSGSCKFSMIGALSGKNAEKAAIGYTITGVDVAGNSSQKGTVSGIAGLIGTIYTGGQ